MLIIRNPATGAVIAQKPVDTASQIADKYRRARKAQPTWAQTPYQIRAAAILRFRDLLIKNADDLAQTLSAEMGKPLSQAKGEIRATPQRIDFFLKHTEEAMKEELAAESGLTGGTREVITQEPLGVIANISAWNYPYFVGNNVFIPALLTGNTVLYKPSEFATLSGIAIDSMMHEAGIPADAFITVIGGGAEGAEILKHPVNGVFFTGSYGTGKKIAESVAGRMIRIQLELGGKDPVYVCEDVDIEKAAESLAEGAFYNAGQSCCAVERIYVNEKIYDRFLDAFTKNVKSYKCGDPMQDGTFIGPLTRAPQLDILDRQVQEARDKGARILAGGKRMLGPGQYYEPTVIADANNSLAVMREESFGPVIGLQKVKDDEEALRLMNDTDYGLTAGVYTANEDRAKRILSQVDSGSVYWNCCDRVSPRLPWTGRRNSGMGSTLSVIGIRAFLQPRAWHLRAP